MDDFCREKAVSTAAMYRIESLGKFDGKSNEKKVEGSDEKAKSNRMKMHAYGSSKRYSSMIRLLQGIDREDLQTLWKLIKTKHGDSRPEDDHEKVLWGDLKVMFEPDIKSDVWRNLQGYKVTIWKLFDSCGVHFVRLLMKKLEDSDGDPFKFRDEDCGGLNKTSWILRVTTALVHNGIL
ncbi:hypothetical protein Tco_1281849 [Tanacetum coccineum]